MKPEILYEGAKTGRMALVAVFHLFGFRILIGIPRQFNCCMCNDSRVLRFGDTPLRCPSKIHNEQEHV
jgi:hypothetical protein